MRIHRPFPSAYVASDAADVATAGYPVLYVPGDSPVGRDGPAVLIEPHAAEPFIAVFASADGNTLYAATCPDPDLFLCVAFGCAYVIDVHTRSFGEVPVCPVTDVRAVPESRAVVFTDYTKIVCLLEGRRLVVSERISRDGIEITEIADGFVYGTASPPPVGTGAAFRLEIATGRHTGGDDNLGPFLDS